MSTDEHARGITVGLSWPRPATPCALVPRWEGEFVSHADWVNFASKRLTVARDSNGAQLKAICVDALGRRCANGGDMQRAHDEGAFPVRYFWDCQPGPSANAELVSEAAFLIERLEEAERDMADDAFSHEYYGHVSPSVARLKAILAKFDAPHSDGAGA